jgi:hypothetical protein
MINQGKNVPDNTIVFFLTDEISKEEVESIISPIDKKRDWFTPHFYRCLPLTIANKYGFVIKAPFTFSVDWNGGIEREDLKILISEEHINSFPKIESHFGSGIVTVSIPLMMRTPPNINIMTINPPNYILQNFTVMSGSIETDNLRYTFTFNIKMQNPGRVTIPKDTPLSGFIPVERNFIDNFSIKYAEDIFDEDTIIEELNAIADQKIQRQEVDGYAKNFVNRNYFTGRDIYGNKFPNHQKP